MNWYKRINFWIETFPWIVFFLVNSVPNLGYIMVMNQKSPVSLKNQKNNLKNIILLISYPQLYAFFWQSALLGNYILT